MPPKIPFGYGSLKGKIEIRPDIDPTKPVYDQVFNFQPRFLDHSLTEEETEKMVDEVAADMRKALKIKPEVDTVFKAKAEAVLAAKMREPVASDGFKIVNGDGQFWMGDPDHSWTPPAGRIFAGSEAAASSEAEAQRAISVAMKAFAALCRQGIETVELDGETIDLWDVKRDLRGLLGPDEV